MNTPERYSVILTTIVLVIGIVCIAYLLTRLLSFADSVTTDWQQFRLKQCQEKPNAEIYYKLKCWEL